MGRCGVPGSRFRSVLAKATRCRTLSECLGQHGGVRIRGLIFDLDGTLADTLPVCYTAFRRVFRKHLGREVSDAEIHGMFGPCERGVIQRILPDWGPAFQMFLEEYEAAHDVCLEPFSGVIDMLDWLESQGLPIAVVTGKGPESAAISLRRLGLSDRFEIVESGSTHGPVKPESISRILELWKFDPGEVVHVGDAPSDVRSARKCGIIAVAAGWAPGARREALAAEEPDAQFDSVSELHAWLAAAVAAEPRTLEDRSG